MSHRILLFFLLVILLTGLRGAPARPVPGDAYAIQYRLDVRQQHLKMYWKDNEGRVFRSLSNLKNGLEGQGETLVFAMNGGMYTPNHSPQGLFIEEGKTMAPLDTLSGDGNFYLKPNGVFFTTQDNAAGICRTEDFPHQQNIRYATQSGPMLLIGGQIHPAFRKGSSHLNIRNGVGILPDGRVLLAMSRAETNLYDFARFFKDQGCQEALYLDGFVSRVYLPEQNCFQLDGNFGVILGVTKPQ